MTGVLLCAAVYGCDETGRVLACEKVNRAVVRNEAGGAAIKGYGIGTIHRESFSMRQFNLERLKWLLPQKAP